MMWKGKLIMKKSYVIIWTILTVVFIGIVSIVPIRRSKLSENGVSYDQPIPTIAHGAGLTQQFVPQHDYMEYIEVYVNALECDKSQGVLSVQLLDAGQNLIAGNTIALGDLPDYGKVRILENVTVKAGTVYCLTLNAADTADSGPSISFYPDSVAASTEETGYSLTYGGVPFESAVLRMTIGYSVPVKWFEYGVYLVFLTFVFMLILPDERKK